jgi:hypothetical protein
VKFLKGNVQLKEERKKKRKTNPINTKPVEITVHATPRETGIAKKN